MRFDFLEDVLANKVLQDQIAKNRNIRVKGTNRGERGLLLSAVEKKLLVVCPDLISLGDLKRQMEACGRRVKTLDCFFDVPTLQKAKKTDKMSEFLTIFYQFLHFDVDTLLLTPESLLTKLPLAKVFEQNFLKLKTGQNLEFSLLARKLLGMGFLRTEQAGERGEFCIKGDVILLHLPSGDKLSLDFFGNTLEKLTLFSSEENEDKKTVKKREITSYNLTPATPVFYDEKSKNSAMQSMLLSFQKGAQKPAEKETLKNNMIQTVERLKENDKSGDMQFVMPFLQDENGEPLYSETILSVLKNDDTAIVFLEPKKVLEELVNIHHSLAENIRMLIGGGELLPEHQHFFFTTPEVVERLPSPVVAFETVVAQNNPLALETEIVFQCQGERKYLFDFEALAYDLTTYKKTGFCVILFTGGEASTKAIFEFLLEKGINASIVQNAEKIRSTGIYLSSQFLPQSASFTREKIVLVGTEDLVKKYAREEHKLSSKRGVFALPKVGDYVVHDKHGIGKCVGTERMKIGESEHDYFILEYDGGARIYVPSEQANIIALYLGGEGTPKLNRIGGQEFERAKQRVRESLKEVAFDLLKLYKEREKLKGFVYPTDNELTKEFDEDFPYDPTDDQLKAAQEVIGDMQKGKVMDRLVCGDVGFGKTEVALRAAFRAVMGGKQVMLLCPTTILSEQHFSTARKRMKDMVRIAILNRFKSDAEQKQIAADLAAGRIDLIIGTSRLLSKDIVFKDLGLLILDEEQRFGVNDKEKIKTIQKNVNVLTMTATPIPRTLSLSLSGIRDISIIETPPKNRLPVQTHISEYSDELLTEACRRELSRGGQTIIVSNCVEKIDAFANHVRMLLPSARVGVAHGQMNESELERTVQRMYNEEFDVIVASTIIENGIDLPLANTLLVMDSVNMGLAQLYQLRGRVGRSTRLAYAYFTYDKNKEMTETAYKRLEALSEFTELGSGFRVAMRDLEIRGAGSLLGARQSGHLEKVGYDMYQKILAEEVSFARGEKRREVRETKMEIALSAFIPESYIADENERIKAYGNISEVQTREEAEKTVAEFLRVFGTVPGVVKNLVKIALLKNLCQKIGAKRVFISGEKAFIELYGKENLTETVAELLSKNQAKAVLKFEALPTITLRLDGKADDKVESLMEIVRHD